MCSGKTGARGSQKIDLTGCGQWLVVLGCLAVGVAGFSPSFTHAQSCTARTQNSTSPAVALTLSGSVASVIHYRVVNRYPHDPNAFTQGLVYYRGDLYESTGLRGHSAVRRLALKSGRVLDERRIGHKLFGEGLAVLGKQLVQLTWQAGSAFTYTIEDLSQSGEFSFEGEGWGATRLNGELVISDGSSRLRFLSPDDYHQTHTLQVSARGRPLEGLNELEAVGGLIYANVYPSDCIARIDPYSGHVVGWLDLHGLMPVSERPHRSAVANGIAYNAHTGDLFVTGKLWPYLYQLRLQSSAVLPKKRATSSDGRRSMATKKTTGGG